jgi:hypothetical protein
MMIQVRIEGLTPLLMNRFTESESASTNRGTPREQAARAAYCNAESGELYVPGPNMLAALVDAGRFHRLGRKHVTTEKHSLVPVGLRVPERMIPLGTAKYDVDSRRVRMPATGEYVMRHRARVDPWKATFSVDVDEQVFSAQFVRALVDDCGQKIGLGDYRPATRGPFGRFVVAGWEAEA